MSAEVKRVVLEKSFRFEAAHHLPRVPDDHPCRRVHGHSYKLEVRVAGDLDPQTGWLMDFADISAAVRPLVERLDHHDLNTIEGLENPTAEWLAVWIWDRLEPALPGLDEIVVAETEKSRCRYRGGR